MNISNKDKIAVKKLLNVADRINNCTKCMVKPIVKEHMCEKCYVEHYQWLKDMVSGTTTVKDKIDADGYFTVYESGARR